MFEQMTVSAVWGQFISFHQITLIMRTLIFLHKNSGAPQWKLIFFLFAPYIQYFNTFIYCVFCNNRLPIATCFHEKIFLAPGMSTISISVRSSQFLETIPMIDTVIIRNS